MGCERPQRSATEANRTALRSPVAQCACMAPPVCDTSARQSIRVTARLHCQADWVELLLSSSLLFSVPPPADFTAGRWRQRARCRCCCRWRAHRCAAAPTPSLARAIGCATHGGASGSAIGATIAPHRLSCRTGRRPSPTRPGCPIACWPCRRRAAGKSCCGDPPPCTPAGAYRKDHNADHGENKLR